jgi:hypothetical protein
VHIFRFSLIDFVNKMTQRIDFVHNMKPHIFRFSLIDFVHKMTPRIDFVHNTKPRVKLCIGLLYRFHKHDLMCFSMFLRICNVMSVLGLKCKCSRMYKNMKVERS